MNAYISDPSSGELLATYKLSDTDLLDCRIYADKYANAMGVSIDESDGYIPTCCGDINVTLSDNPHGHTVCWSSESFYLEVE